MKKLLLAVGLAILGLVAAALVASPTAQAWTTDQLPSLGYAVTVINLDGTCRQWLAGYGPNSQKTDLGSDCDAGFQQRLDDFVRATCPCAQTTAAPTTDAPTTTAIGDTSTSTATETTPPPPPPPITTATTTSTVDDALVALSARIAALEAQIAALTTRVEKLELAGQAAQLAFDQAIAGGMDVPSAAALARATYLNAEYGLGAFAS